MKYKSKIDVAVLILFFNRPELLRKVFEQVKLARPSKLYLYQDGAREGRADDIINIQKCREIVSDIDWDCEVHTNYCEKNYGCDPSEYLAQKWMFETEEMGIILEDDDVPSQSFFPFCKELLEKYKDDQRINMICGMNNCEISEHCPYDYLFSTSGSIWGWATWKRVIDEWSEKIEFLNDDYSTKLFELAFKNKRNVKDFLNACERCNKSNIAFYEFILNGNALLNSRLNIVPSKNMISNLGFSGESTHGASDVKFLPKAFRKIFNMKRYDYEFPLKHPPYVIEDLIFLKKINKVMATNHPIIAYSMLAESVVYRMLSGDFSMFKRKFKRLFKK